MSLIDRTHLVRAVACIKIWTRLMAQP